MYALNTPPESPETTSAFTNLVGASLYLGTSVPTTRKMIAEGILPASKVRGRVLIRKSDIDAMLDRNRIRPRSNPTEPRVSRIGA